MIPCTLLAPHENYNLLKHEKMITSMSLNNSPQPDRSLILLGRGFAKQLLVWTTALLISGAAAEEQASVAGSNPRLTGKTYAERAQACVK